jgi:NAD(P)H-hydrate epimerase
MTASKLYPASVIKEIDRQYSQDYDISSFQLMTLAARRVVEVILTRYSDIKNAQVFCGSGNNAGDGFLIAAGLADRGWLVQVVLVGDTEKLSDASREAFAVCQNSQAIVQDFEGSVLAGAVLVDALLGLGIRGDVTSAYRSAIMAINAGSGPVVAVDLPSGLQPDSGDVGTACVRASITITFLARKVGLYSQDGPDYAGEIMLADLGLPEALLTKHAAKVLRVLDAPRLPARQNKAHKGHFGHLLVVGGNTGFGGAGLLASEAAVRSGAGLVSVVSREAHRSGFLARCPEVMFRGVTETDDITDLLDRVQAVVLGPGLGQDAWAQNLYRQVIAAGKPLVLDADGLNLLAQAPVPLLDCIMTPHPLEAARLLRRDQVDPDRLAVVGQLQSEYGAVVVLKGAATLVASNSGIAINVLGGPAMATAGMGDVLSGLLGALLAQGEPLSRAAELGVAHHGRAARMATAQQGEVGLLARDVVMQVGRSLSGIVL